MRPAPSKERFLAALGMTNLGRPSGLTPLLRSAVFCDQPFFSVQPFLLQEFTYHVFDIAMLCVDSVVHLLHFLV